MLSQGKALAIQAGAPAAILDHEAMDPGLDILQTDSQTAGGALAILFYPGPACTMGTSLSLAIPTSLLLHTPYRATS